MSSSRSYLPTQVLPDACGRCSIRGPQSLRRPRHRRLPPRPRRKLRIRDRSQRPKIIYRQTTRVHIDIGLVALNCSSSHDDAILRINPRKLIHHLATALSFSNLLLELHITTRLKYIPRSRQNRFHRNRLSQTLLYSSRHETCTTTPFAGIQRVLLRFRIFPTHRTSSDQLQLELPNQFPRLRHKLFTRHPLRKRQRATLIRKHPTSILWHSIHHTPTQQHHHKRQRQPEPGSDFPIHTQTNH